MLRLILIFVSLISLALFIGTYEANLFTYYEESKADNLTDKVCIPLLAGICIYSLMRTLRTSSQQATTWNRVKEAFKKIIVYCIFYFFILRWVLSGAVLIINSQVGDNHQVPIRGEVIEVYRFNSDRSSEYKITVQAQESNSIYVFTTNEAETKKFNLHEDFEKSFTKGCLGLLYIK